MSGNETIGSYRVHYRDICPDCGRVGESLGLVEIEDADSPCTHHQCDECGAEWYCPTGRRRDVDTGSDDGLRTDGGHSTSGSERPPPLPAEEIEVKLRSARRWVRFQLGGPPVSFTDNLLAQLDLGRKRDLVLAAMEPDPEPEPETIQTTLLTDGGTSGSERDTIQCDHCGTAMWDNEQTRREMELHEAECDGLDDPKARFEVGDRVEYSDFGRERLSVEPREGEIVGFGSEKHRNGHCVRVLWDGRKTPERYAHSFIRLAEGGS